ncbi:MAG: ribose 5-phosphate isomerase B, partial [Candidatus Omnitrophota bacterium]|nr:ribose 5-phosphate isomerase B [Candidatus Omnitrophota bacterium]
GADHGGFDLKKDIVDFLRAWHYQVKYFGTFSAERCDYPKIGYKVASSIASGKFERGILICKSGIGMCIVANKVHGVRAVLLPDEESARVSRQHNDANIAIFSGKSINIARAKRILEVWLSTDFEGGRHLKRIKQIKKIEEMIRRGSK